MKVLNLYAGLGGNRKLWTGVDVTAVELDQKIAAVYQELNPNDQVVVDDAHQFLLDHYVEYDFIWSSPPCQSHSKMDLCNPRNKPRYFELNLYQEIIFLQSYFKGKWVVENVVPYYKPLVSALRLGRHLFWSNFHIPHFIVPSPNNFISLGKLSGAVDLKKWLGINYTGNIYYGDNHDTGQVLRNCVHPKVGEHIFKAATQTDLFGRAIMEAQCQQPN